MDVFGLVEEEIGNLDKETDEAQSIIDRLMKWLANVYSHFYYEGYQEVEEVAEKLNDFTGSSKGGF